MTDNPPPFEIHPDEHLAARITAYALGEASAFEAAEIESLVAKSPELKLFLNRIRALDTLLKKAEAAPDSSDENWKLHPGKKIKLTRALGDIPEIPSLPVEKRNTYRFAKISAIGIAACLAITFLAFRLAPKEYEAEATIEVRPGNSTRPLGSMLSDSSPTMTPMFFGTEFEKIKSRNSLEKVVDRLDLADKWNTDKETALRKLKASVETKNIKGTDLISIRVRHPNQDDAKDITTEVARAYKEYRTELEGKSLAKNINEIKKAVREQEDKVEERRKVLTTISRTKDIAYYGDSNMRDERKLENLERSIDTQDYVDAKRDFETDQALLEQMKLSLIGKEIERNVTADSIVIHDDPTVTEVTSFRSMFKSPAAAEVSVAERSKVAAIPASSEPLTASNAMTARSQQVHIGGQVSSPGPVDFKDGITLRDAVIAAGDSTPFGSTKRVKVFRDGKTKTYDLSKPEFANLELQPNDTIEIPQKNWMGCGASRDELTAAAQERSSITAGNRSGDSAINRNNIDAILNSPEGMAKLAEQQLPEAKRELSLPDAAPSSPTPPTSAAAPEAEGATLLAQREIIRRKSAVADADKLLLEGRDAYAKGDYGKAAENRRDGEDVRIKKELGYLDDSIRTNPALSGEKTENVDKVRRQLYMAQGNFDLGKFDDAKKNYEDTLRIDPYNTAARRGMEKIAATKSDYYRAAYDQTRAELLTQVDSAWELSVPKERSVDLSPQLDDTSDLYAEISDHAASNKFRDLDMVNRLSGESDRPVQGYHWADNSNYGFDGSDIPDGLDGFANFGAPIAGAPKQAEITTKFVDVTQANNEELAFDWIAKPFNFDLITRSGNAKAKIDATREFSYPTEYEAPELPNSFSKSTGPFPVTPATLTEFETVKADKVPLLGDIPIVGKLFSQPVIDLSEEIPAAQEPFSTFSLNISDASFQIARAAIEKGERPDPTSIKPEQFYNAIDYGDPAPSSREPVAAAIDQTAHPVIPGRNLVRIGVRTASTGRSAAQPLRLTLLVDQSGSMVRKDRRAAMETALEQLATLLTEQDRITVVGFSRTPRLLADSLPGNQANKLPDLINQTASEGGTNLEQAINLASELALRHKQDGAQNRIVLFTDGAANLGNADPERLSEKIETLRQQGLAFDIAGIGTDGLNDNLLAELARHGNGRYYLVGENTASSLASQLAGAFRPAAENVKVQVKLNPQRVGSYKLIGFEKDRLKTEDFRNDSIDAAELAADEAGVAMYQIETLPEGSGEIGEVSVRFRDTASGEMVERTWTIAYDPTAPAFDQANPKTQLATLSLLAAQELQGGPLAEAINLGNFSDTIAKLRQTYKADPKIQQLLNLVNALK